jgi:tetratricopeptide (TPR) repeat protein
MKPYCFILMPFGTKTDASGKSIEFDLVYENIFKPAVIKSNLTPIRADEEFIGGIIHKPMFERLMLCDYAIADLTSANANVFYELGIRHGIRPHSTILTFSEGIRLLFDVAPLRALPYSLDEFGVPNDIDNDIDKIVGRLEECRNPVDDSPLFQLVTDMPRVDISRLKTDTFRDSITYSEEKKELLKIARGSGLIKVKEVENELGNIVDVNPAIVVDLFLSYRAVEDWDSMIELSNKMVPILRGTILIQEQLGFAYNRRGEHQKAESILNDLIESHGTSSETNGILGRVYKDLWTKAKETGFDVQSKGYLDKAIECYLEGFETDWRDAYPGINAVTLMEMKKPIDQRQAKILPVIRYAVERRMATKNPDYWDYATLLELNVLAKNKDEAMTSLSKVLISIREKWEPKTTANNLQKIIEVREERNEDIDWIKEINNELIKAYNNG